MFLLSFGLGLLGCYLMGEIADRFGASDERIMFSIIVAFFVITGGSHMLLSLLV